MDVYATEFWDRIIPVSFTTVRGTVVSDYGFILVHSAPWALETW
jgi:hypothetical protein